MGVIPLQNILFHTRIMIYFKESSIQKTGIHKGYVMKIIRMTCTLSILLSTMPLASMEDYVQKKETLSTCNNLTNPETLLSSDVCNTDNPSLGIDPHNNVDDEPAFFFAKTVDAAQSFINNNVNIHAKSAHYENILWRALSQDYPADLLLFYLNHGVDHNARDNNDSCLLHALGSYRFIPHTDVNNFLDKAQILVDRFPEMVNIVNNNDQTPLDSVERMLEVVKFSKKEPVEAAQKFIKLLKAKNGVNYKNLPALSV
jgi:hypothetical protein